MDLEVLPVVEVFVVEKVEVETKVPSDITDNQVEKENTDILVLFTTH